PVARPIVWKLRVICCSNQWLFFPGAVRRFLINPSSARADGTKGNSRPVGGPDRRKIRSDIKCEAPPHTPSQVKQPNFFARTRARIDSRCCHSSPFRRERKVGVCK